MTARFLDDFEIDFEILVDFEITDYIEINIEILITISGIGITYGHIDRNPPAPYYSLRKILN